MRAGQAQGLPFECGAQEVTRREFRGFENPERVLTTGEVAADLEVAAGSLLIDARDTARFRGEVEPIDTRAGHIPGSRNLPFTACLREDGTWQDGDSLRHLLERVLGDDERASWAVMCGSGVTACHLAISGLLAGYSEPSVYVGSWSEWIRDPSRPIGVGAGNR